MLHRILQAQQYLRDHIEPTPLLPSTPVGECQSLSLKAENLQKTGSFKVRGAYFKMAQLTPAERRQGVIACSAGNHAQGVALAASEMGIRSVVCMPKDAPISKITRTTNLGATVLLQPGGLDKAMDHAHVLEEKDNLLFVHPFNDPDIVAGQGTIGLEILEQKPQTDVIFVAVGGGGLATGIAAAVKAIKPDCQVIGVEPAGAASMKQSLEAGKITPIPLGQTVADGVAVNAPGKVTFDLAQKFLDQVVTVTETQITLAMLDLLENHKLLVEGAGAVSVAAAHYAGLDLTGKNVVCVLSGGNVDINMVELIIAKGLRHTGRVMSFDTTIPDKPFQLHRVIGIISDAGANILGVQHDRTDLNVSLDQCVVHITFETRDSLHQAQVIKALSHAGYQIREQKGKA